MLGAARTRVHASHGGAHGPENRREKVPKSARAGTGSAKRGKKRKEAAATAAAAAAAASAARRGAEKEEQEEASKRGPLRRRLP